MRQYMFNQRTCLLWLQKGVLWGLVWPYDPRPKMSGEPLSCPGGESVECSRLSSLQGSRMVNSALGLSLFQPAGLGALALPPRLAHAHRLPSAILGHRRPDATCATAGPLQGSGSQPGSCHHLRLGGGASGSHRASQCEPSTPGVPKKWGQAPGHTWPGADLPRHPQGGSQQGTEGQRVPPPWSRK